ncbi:MAG: hypothetical protein EA339_06105 [Rhodobacteraceae bacterium]|nr:MAG: hypothetical protein EA339_06105 [Paracoccaceae bacterium]
MSSNRDHYEIYEKLADMIDYCQSNNLPETQNMLTRCMGVLCREESLQNGAHDDKVCMFPVSRSIAERL